MDIQTEVDNTARDHLLRVHFPAPFTAREADFDGHFEIVRRKTGVPEFDSTWIEQPRPEQPQRAFITITNQKLGLMLANRGLPEVEAISKAEGGSEIALTLLRCTGWLSRDDFATRTGHAGPAFETPEAQMQGKHSFEYSVMPFKIYPEDDQCETYWEACRQAWAYHSPMRSLSAGIHSGQLPEKTSFIEIYTADFAISTIKTTEDCKGWIVRGYNPTPKPLQVKIKSRQDYSKVWKARLDETPVEKLEIDPEEGIVFNARPNEVVTIRLEQ
jgi:alpha-mannosidase